MNLRGTVKRFNAPMSRQLPLDYKLQQLARQIRRNKPAVENHRGTFTLAIPASGYTKANNAITNDFITSADFRKTIIGDRFSNLYLRHSHVFPSTCLGARIIVYATKRTGVTFNPSNDQAGFITNPDPSFVRVLSDNYINMDQATARTKAVKLYTPLKNMTTVYNESSNILETGEIYMLVFIQGSATGADVSSNTQLFVRNK